jgi:hypothetical protein
VGRTLLSDAFDLALRNPSKSPTAETLGIYDFLAFIGQECPTPVGEVRHADRRRESRWWRLHPERWLESLVVKDFAALDDSLDTRWRYSRNFRSLDTLRGRELAAGAPLLVMVALALPPERSSGQSRAKLAEFRP